MRRRDFIKASLATAALSTFGELGMSPVRSFAASTERFNQKLTIPPELTPSLEGEAAASLLRAGSGVQSFLPDMQTKTLGYNGGWLGPTIRVRNGQQVRLNVINTLDQKTTLHWHGLHVPAKWDGGPHQVIDPGATWKPRFTIRQQAATLWYHPHAMGLTGEQVYRGLGGLFIIDDEVTDALALPKNYGEDDIPLILQDRRFYEDGSFAYVTSMHDVMQGVRGNYLLVNGTIRPYVEVPKGMVRLRILNGSNSSIYRLRLSSEQQLLVIGSDGGLLERPVPVSDLVLSAGERVELLLDCSTNQTGDRLTLIVDQYGGESYEALEIRVGKEKGRHAKAPEFLRQQQPLDATVATNSRRFLMETMSGRGMGMMGGRRLTINGQKMDMNRIDEQIDLGTTEIWELINTSSSMMQLPHSMHLHDVQFNILERNGKAPEPVEAGRKDTVLLWPGDTVKIIARFADYTGVYMYHCHMLEHEDDGMMGQFEVVARDREKV